MIVGVADTHTAIWYLEGDQRLSTAAKTFLDRANENGHQIALSSISLVEIVYLTEKGRLSPTVYYGILGLLKTDDHILVEIDVSVEIAGFVSKVSREDIPDMPDRIIAATAFRYNVPVITRDGRIRASNLQTIW